jgi:Ca2+-transporting ATPase
VENVSVYARVSPKHKLRIAQSLKRRGHVVAMTGDGVNDAPAIKAADIGIAMGIKGTDVTKEAADMVLEDDNFATIVKAVEGGRHIFDNIKKYMRLMISTNFDEFLELTVMALLGLPFTLLPIHILWVNLVTDGLPAIALSMDPKSPGLMTRKPRDQKTGFLRPMWRFLFFVALLDFVTNLIPFIVILTNEFTYWGPWPENHPLLLLARAETFTCLVFFEIFLAYACRSEDHSILGMGWKSLISNKMLLYATFGSWIIQLAILYVPFLNSVFKVAPLPPFWLAVAILNSLTALIVHPGMLLNKKANIEDYIAMIGFSTGIFLMLYGVFLHSFGNLFWGGIIIFCISIFIMYDGDIWVYRRLKSLKTKK